IASTRTAGIDHRGGGRTACDEARIDAERCRLVVDMSVYVDQPWRDDGPADVLDLSRAAGQRLAYCGNPARSDGNVEHCVDAISLVENATALQDQIVALCGCRVTHRVSPGFSDLHSRSVRPARAIAGK